jgi:hypothetical protein
LIIKNGKEYYPLDFGKMIKDEKIYYDRSMRRKNYFYLVLQTQPTLPITNSSNEEINNII